MSEIEPLKEAQSCRRAAPPCAPPPPPAGNGVRRREHDRPDSPSRPKCPNEIATERISRKTSHASSGRPIRAAPALEPRVIGAGGMSASTAARPAAARAFATRRRAPLARRSGAAANIHVDFAAAVAVMRAVVGEALKGRESSPTTMAASPSVSASRASTTQRRRTDHRRLSGLCARAAPPTTRPPPASARMRSGWGAGDRRHRLGGDRPRRRRRDYRRRTRIRARRRRLGRAYRARRAARGDPRRRRACAGKPADR